MRSGREDWFTVRCLLHLFFTLPVKDIPATLGLVQSVCPIEAAWTRDDVTTLKLPGGNLACKA